MQPERPAERLPQPDQNLGCCAVGNTDSPAMESRMGFTGTCAHPFKWIGHKIGEGTPSSPIRLTKLVLAPFSSKRRTR
jgi:hypothetical protein